jgi:ABC-2 type transport system permease protein
MMQIARFPLDIYKSGIRNILTFAVPIAFLAMAPTQQLTQAISWQMVLIGIVWTAAALFLSRRFWQYAMVHYSSASS